MDINKILREQLKAYNQKINEGGMFDDSRNIDNTIDEAIITLGNKLYPKGGNGVIFAGGSGSGKGFVKDNLLGIEGKVLDADKLKELYMKSVKLKNSLKNDFGLDIENFDFKNPEHVKQLHLILQNKGIGDSQLRTLSHLVQEVGSKPNLIFDTTLYTVTKFYNICSEFQQMGYKSENIHLVWVLTDFQTAFKSNLNRSRTVPEVVFNDIHKGVSRTMKEILNMSNLGQLMDGDIYLVFNNPQTDTKLSTSASGGKYVESANYIKLKNSGQPLKSYAEINKEIIDKINGYVHPDTKW